MKITITEARIEPRRLAPFELTSGEIVSLSKPKEGLKPHFLRIVTENGVFNFQGHWQADKDDTTPCYYKLPPGTKITLEVE